MKKISVPIPEKNTATFGSNPISKGATMVDPDIASRCWTPIGRAAPKGSLSSGMTVALSVGLQLGK